MSAVSSTKLRVAVTVRISNLAERDLLSIWTYTLEEWGETQADAYIESFAGKFSLLASLPGAGRSIDEVRPGYRRARHGSHLIFSRQVEDGVEIVRVLHQQMDPTLHL